MKFVSTYFNAEKYESVFFILVGILAFMVAIYGWFIIKEAFYKGLAIPLVLVAMIQITVGTTVYFRSPKDILKLENLFALEPQKIPTKEIPRMNTVMKNFVIYRYTELALIITGFALLFMSGDKQFLKGLGTGLIIQAGIMLLLDYFAERRGLDYVNYLKDLN